MSRYEAFVTPARARVSKPRELGNDTEKSAENPLFTWVPELGIFLRAINSEKSKRYERESTRNQNLERGERMAHRDSNARDTTRGRPESRGSEHEAITTTTTRRERRDSEGNDAELTYADLSDEEFAALKSIKPREPAVVESERRRVPRHGTVRPERRGSRDDQPSRTGSW